MKKDWISKTGIDFTEDKEIIKILKNKTPRFMPNPERNWGPKKGACLDFISKKISKKSD